MVYERSLAVAATIDRVHWSLDAVPGASAGADELVSALSGYRPRVFRKKSWSRFV